MKFRIILIQLLTVVLFNLNAQENQNVELLKLTSGNFTVNKVVEGGSNFKFETSAKPWPISFNKEGDRFTEIVINRAGIIEEKYQADLPGFPAYYKSTTSEIVITAIDKKIYYYTWSVKMGATIKYIFSESKVKNYLDEKTILENYRNSIKELQISARSQRIEENNAIAEKLAEENTLKGKKIKSVKIIPINNSTEIGLLSILAIGIEFELDNGKILKTTNLGGFTPYTDIETEVSGGDFAGGDFKIADDSRKIVNDKIEITAWSKFDDKKIKSKYSLPLNYKKDVNYNFQGASGASGRGYTVGYTVNGTNGMDGKSVNITVTSITINNEKINKLSITDASTGKLLTESKIQVNYTLNINTNGGSGGNGTEGKDNGGNGGHGGNGGNIILSGNGIESLKIMSTTYGGKGGVGGKAKTQVYNNGINGSTGSNGIVTK